MYNKPVSSFRGVLHFLFMTILLGTYSLVKPEQEEFEILPSGDVKGRGHSNLSIAVSLALYDESLKGKITNNPSRIILDIDAFSKVIPLSCIETKPECETEMTTYGSHAQHYNSHPDMWQVFTGVMGRYVYTVPVFYQLAGVSPSFWDSLNSVIVASNSYYFNRATCNEVTAVSYMKLLAEQERELARHNELTFPYIYKVVVQNKVKVDLTSSDYYDHVFLMVSKIAIPDTKNIKSHSDITMLSQEVQDSIHIIDVYNSRIFTPLYSEFALAMHSGRYCAKISVMPMINYKELQRGASKFPGSQGPFLKAMQLSEQIQDLGHEAGVEGKKIIAELKASRPDKEIFEERYGFSPA
ncbi:MAG: hypothetical protein Q7V63_05305 [Gammaproteobacteria bacterium]|nr:hypothetical protein [Gammaproteobacteria bacterium]